MSSINDIILPGDDSMKEKDTELNISIGQKIKEYREHMKLTQDFIAKELELATNHYGRIERGENSCTMSNLIKLCKILKVSPNELLSEHFQLTNQDFFEYFNKLTIEDKELLKEIAILLHSKYDKN